MKFELNWAWALTKLRLIFLVAAFISLYHYISPIIGFAWLAYFILNDLSEIINDLEKSKEEQDEHMRTLRSLSTKRKGF